MAVGTLIAVHWPESDARVRIELGGEIDMLLRDQLCAVVADVDARGPLAVEVDLSDVTFFGSTGIEFLLRLHGLARTFALTVVPPCVVRVLELSGVDELLTGRTATPGERRAAGTPSG